MARVCPLIYIFIPFPKLDQNPQKYVLGLLEIYDEKKCLVVLSVVGGWASFCAGTQKSTFGDRLIFFHRPQGFVTDALSKG